MSRLKLKGLTRTYGAFTAVDDILEVGDGEFVTLLGPSGCGKTTTLRMVAGFIEPDSGEIWFDDRLMTTVAPQHRDGVPILRAVPAHDGRAECRLRPQDAQPASGRAGQAHRGSWRW